METNNEDDVWFVNYGSTAEWLRKFALPKTGDTLGEVMDISASTCPQESIPISYAHSASSIIY